MKRKKIVDYGLANSFFFLGLFGLVHGITEWIDLSRLYLKINGFSALAWLDASKIVFLTISFLLLMQFGINLLIIKKKEWNILKWIPLSLGVLFFVYALSTGVFFSSEILARYGFGFTGSLLATLGLFNILRSTKGSLRGLRASANAMFLAFVVYTVFGGLITFTIYGMPPQLIRMLCAVVVGLASFKFIEVLEHKRERDIISGVKSLNFSIIAKFLAAVVILGGIVVMIGWFLDIAVLKSILPGWVSMKFITSFSFLLSGILVYLLAKRDRGEFVNLLILVISFGLMLLMLTFFVSLFFRVSTGIESLFVAEAPGAVKTTIPGVPAIPTMICFILIALSGFIFSFDFSKRVLSWTGGLVGVIGGLAVLGYLANLPVFYYTFEGYTSMAFSTAVLFVLLGIALILTRVDSEQVRRVR
ncbi:MAG: hypothetical protein WCK90_01730 [archaeon]